MNLKLLKQLTATPGVPGREDRVRELIKKEVKGLFDELKTDAMGNLIGVRKPRPEGKKTKSTKKTTKVMLAAHMDQIGFLVRHVDDKGIIRVNNVGGFDCRNLFARHVLVCTASGDLSGVMNPGGKPIHMASEDEKKKIPEVSDFFIDVGLDADEVKKKVQIGDMVVLTAPFQENGDSIVSQCLDNRAGCWAVIEAMKKVKKHKCEIHAVWTVQEEVGLRGAGPAAFGVEPDIGISCDTTLCCDTPGISEDQQVTKFGAGVCLKVADSSTIADLKLLESIEKVAKAKKIPWQRGILPRGGQDGAMLQRTRSGCRTAVFACPVKFIHTVIETSHRTDLKSYPDLLAAYLGSI